MNIAERAVETMSGSAERIRDASGAAVPYRWQVYFACIALALACNYLLGKDMAWDTLNYHLYLGFSALNDRFSHDYLPQACWPTSIPMLMPLSTQWFMPVCPHW